MMGHLRLKRTLTDELFIIRENLGIPEQTHSRSEDWQMAGWSSPTSPLVPAFFISVGQVTICV